MREIQVQKLTKDNFGKYGEFLDLLDESELKKKSIFQEGFFADVVALEFNQGNQPTISVCHVKKQSENIISFLEAHQYACEGLLPLDGDVIIFVGIMDSDFRTESIEAFYVPKGTFVKLNPLIVHGTQYPVDKEDVHIVCMLPGRTFKNDMLSRRLETGEQIRITRGDLLYRSVIDNSRIIINLASKEYSKCIEKYLTRQDRYITITFCELSGDKLVTKGTYAKMARGEMVRFMAENRIENPEDIKKFDRLGYSFRSDLSSDAEYVFERKTEITSC